MRDDIALFGDKVCDELTPDKTDCVLHKDIQKIHHDKTPLAAIIAPRGHAKTQWASTISSLHDLAYDREDVIVLIKKNYRFATTDLISITSFIKYNPLWDMYFGQYEYIKDREDIIHVVNPTTGHKTWIQALGAGGAVRGIVVEGKRPTKILLDDFEDESNTNTLDAREKVRDWITAQVMPSLDPKTGHLVAIGTIVHYDSWLYNLWESFKTAKNANKAFSWHVIFHEIIEKGKPIWPERFTPKYIADLRDRYEQLNQMHKYYQEYHNIPFDPSTQTFSDKTINKRDFLYYYDEDIDCNILSVDGEEKIVDIVIAYDPSSGKAGRKSDYTGICVLATDASNRRWHIEADRKMLKPDQFKDLFFANIKKYHPRAVILEEVSMQVFLEYWMRDEMIKQNVFVQLIPFSVSTRETKEDKLREGLQPLYEAGIMYHRSTQTDAFEELLTFPKGKHDDILDAEFMANKHSRKPETTTPEVKRKKKERKKKFKKAYDWMTGRQLEAA